MIGAAADSAGVAGAPSHTPDRVSNRASSSAPSRAPRVIVNADDFGSFDCVSRGIIDASRDGVVRATSVLATAPGVAERVQWLADAPSLDLGVHLTLTSGTALSREMRAFRPQLDGLRPAWIAAAVGLRRLRPATVRAEWRAQIEHCIGLGVEPVFLNSHEHVHALPPLFDVVLELAAAYGIRHVRTPRAADRRPPGVRSLLRASAFHALSLGRSEADGPAMLGLHESGRLCMASVDRIFGQLLPGHVYELGCHPGRRDAAEISDPRLLAYHDWDGERALFSGPGVPELAARHGVELVGFRDI